MCSGTGNVIIMHLEMLRFIYIWFSPVTQYLFCIEIIFLKEVFSALLSFLQVFSESWSFERIYGSVGSKYQFFIV